MQKCLNQSQRRSGRCAPVSAEHAECSVTAWPELPRKKARSMPNPCDKWKEEILAIAGDPASASAELQGHLASCRNCAAYQSEADRAIKAVTAAFLQSAPPAALWQKSRAQWRPGHLP